MKIEAASKGGYYAILNSVRIHSSFDPEKEAHRFVSRAVKDEWEGEDVADTLILIAPGLGYLCNAVLQLVKCRRIIIFFLTKESHQFYKEKLSSPTKEEILCWNPTMGQAGAEKILSGINELNFQGVKLLSWPPMIKAMALEGEFIQNLVLEHMRQINGNIHTIGGFGKKWALNCFRNFLRISSYRTLPSLTENKSGVLIVASGSYLQGALPVIKRNSNRFLIISLPSALEALQEADIEPDIIFSTDPGYYASLHYRNLRTSIPLALPLTACSSSLLDYDNNDSNLLLFSQNSFFERILEGASSLSLPVIPECGTVAATALRWACENNSTPLSFSGLDFCFSDIKSHISPHPFEPYLRRDEQRISPYLSTLYSRAREQAPDIQSLGNTRFIRTGRSLNIYKEWTRRFLASPVQQGKEFFSLNPSPVDLGISKLNEGDISGVFPKKTPLSFDRKILLSNSERGNIVKSLLDNWRRDLAGLNLEDLTSPQIHQSPFFYFEPAKIMQVVKKNKEGDSCSALIDELKDSAGDFIQRLERVCGESL